ncbi:1-aminocyclopropane-1-carboxylate deaminase/D-cysteine desulfhydrase [Microbulbifer sp. DLAB2-AF]|uniref:1-aminocyclopropane-1-carboxylate deaminase/D-cysteine desulfhydrase n=1 Tax=Microbulbifer sp. DLAB2-AF TaxID=3243395 RepID=UPI0040399DCB
MSPRLIDSLNLQAFTDIARNIPYQQLKSHLFPGLDVWVRRDDLIDPLISGNKAYKLFYNLIEARWRKAKTIVTCGGAWSNHIHAIAAAGARFGFKTVGIIRGERPTKLSATLQDAERFGMKLVFVTRATYRLRGGVGFLKRAGLKLENFYFIPEGGSNLAGVRGIQLLGQVIEDTAPVKFDQVWVACGTGATFGGLYSSISSASVIGVEVLNAGDSILKDVALWVQRLRHDKSIANKIQCCKLSSLRERLLNSYHCGGYGKSSSAMKVAMEEFEKHSFHPVDPVYMGKLIYALASFDNKIDQKNKTVLMIHSGGLQGGRSYDGGG